MSEPVTHSPLRGDPRAQQRYCEQYSGVAFQSAYGQLPDSCWPVSGLVATHCGCPLLHQPQPGCEAQSVQLPLWLTPL